MQSDTAVNRHEVQLLCHGMKFVRLSFTCDDDLTVAMELLKALHPLQLKVQSKKSLVHHLLCDTLTTILRSAASAGACCVCCWCFVGVLCCCVMLNGFSVDV